MDLLHQRRIHSGPLRYPCVGFGPGAESQAHAPNEITWKQDLVVNAAVYALIPTMYVQQAPDKEDVSQFRAGKTNNNIQ